MKATNPKNYEQAKQAAQRIYKRVNYDGGNLQSYELSSLLQETYDFLKIPFKPSSNNLKEYAKVLDANGDGAVSLQDLQAMAVQYLCGEGVLGSTIQSNKPSDSQFSSSSYANIQATDYSSSNINIQRSSKLDSEGLNYGNYNQHSSGSQYSDQGYMSVGKNMYSGYQQENSHMTNNLSGSGTGNYQYGGSLNSSELGQFGKSTYSSGSNTYGKTNNYLNSQGYPSPTQTQEHLASKNFNSTPVIEQKSKYTPIAQNYLNITRNLFTKYANKPSNTITRDRVASLLNETYSALGRKGYHPSEEDINVWMKLCDTNSDGHVEEAEYEYFVVRALERSGVQVNV